MTTNTNTARVLHRQTYYESRHQSRVAGRALILTVMIPLVLLAMYLGAAAVSLDPVLFDNSTYTDTPVAQTGLQLDPTCSPFASLTACVHVAQPASLWGAQPSI